MPFSRLRAALVLKVLFLALFIQFGLLDAQTSISPQKQAQARSAFLNLPLGFERQGEGNQERFVAQGDGVDRSASGKGRSEKLRWPPPFTGFRWRKRS
jgi:hypothetical protein